MLLQAREKNVNFNTLVNKTQVIAANAGMAAQPGFTCEICNIVVKDNASYLDHLNGRMHQKNLGMSMKVERSTADQVKARLEQIKMKKEFALDAAKDFQTRVKEAQAREEAEKLERKEEKKRQKKQKKEQEEAKLAEFVDDDIAKLMGFGTFGGSKK
ncbi:hypothetical protein HDU96_000939 [Phlyctochytrium bullatum]|nr:hypothetical protein HDU96_000939 [Phlyctochytrium bullatum]